MVVDLCFQRWRTSVHRNNFMHTDTQNCWAAHHNNPSSIHTLVFVSLRAQNASFSSFYWTKSWRVKFTFLQIQTAVNWTSYPMGIAGSSLGGKSAKAWGWSLNPSNTFDKNEWNYTSVPTCDFMACTGTILPIIITQYDNSSLNIFLSSTFWSRK